MARCEPFRCNFRRYLAERFKELFDLDSGDHFYLFLSRVTSWELEPTDPGASDNNPPFNVDSVKSEVEAWQQAFGFKRIGFNDVFLVIPRINWEPGRVYDQYDDDVALFDPDDPKEFYVLVDGRDVYKCLGNNFGGLSTEKPTGTSIEAFVRPNDLYRWKFMYRVPEDLRDFLTEDFIPVEFITGEGLLPDERQLQFNVQEAAIDGSIDFIDLISPGDIDPPAYPFSIPANAVHFVQRSENAIEDTGVIDSFPVFGDVELDNGSASLVNGAYNNMVLRIIDGTGVGEERIILSYDGPNQTATLNAPFSAAVVAGVDSYEVKSREMKGASILSQVNDVFNGYVATIVSGPGIGQQREVVGYDGVTQIFTLKTAWEADLVADANPALSSFYTVTPKVTITGDGQDATAASIVNSEGVISQINVVDRGSGYTRAVIEITPIFPLGDPAEAEASAEISPPGGHGSNAVKEFCARRALIVARADQDELGVFAVANDYRQFGIVRNPLLNGTDTIAGEEIDPQLRIEVARNGTPLVTGSFTVGRSIFGSQSNAVAEIVSWTPDGTGDAGVLIVQNATTQDFVLPDPPAAGEFLHQFDSSFTLVDLDVATVVLVTQVALTVPESYRQTCQITLASDGTVANQLVDASFTLDRIARGQSELRLTDASNYVSAEDLVVGETVTGQISNATGTVVSWTPATVGNPGSLLALSDVAGSFLDGEVVTGGTSGFSIIIDLGGQEDSSVEGIIVQWEPAPDGLTGVLSLVDVRGDFELGELIDEFDQVAEVVTGTSIGEVTAKSDPELEHRSGELLYIQNVKPIQRDIEQAEEFKILVEF